jgi:hypothetical protein
MKRLKSLFLSIAFLAIGEGLILSPPVRAQSPLEKSEQDASALNRPIRDKWALVVGISEFANPSLNLKYSAKDAQDFAAYLVREAGFAPDHVRLLLNKEATERRILSELGDKFLPRTAHPDDLVVLYISTHGSGADLDVGGQNYLIAYDTDVDDLYTTGIPMQKLASDIKERVHCDRVVIFLDACHSGATRTESKGLSRTGIDAGELAVGSGQMVIASSSEDQVSWESKNGANGVFTANLLEALRKKGKDTTIGEMFSELKERVQEQVLRERGRMQTPVLESKWKGNDLCIAAQPVNRRPGLPDVKSASTKVGASIALSQPSVSQPPILEKPIQEKPIQEKPVQPVSQPPISQKPAERIEKPAAAYVKPGILIVPGTSVGRSRLGMSREEVENILGRPTSEGAGSITYRTADRRYFLSLRFSEGKVSEIAFSSPAFQTASGLGLANVSALAADKDSGVKVVVKHGPFTVAEPTSGGLRLAWRESGNSFGVVYKGAPTDMLRWWADLMPGLENAVALNMVPHPLAQAKESAKVQAGSGSQSSSTAQANLIVPGKSIAKIRLGMSRSEIISLLGKPGDQAGSVFSYWTPDRKYILAVRFVDDKASEVLFNSKAFSTSFGLNVANFTGPEFRSYFAPVHQAGARPAPIFTLKEGGLSFIQPVAVSYPMGWLHSLSNRADDMEWMAEIVSDLQKGRNGKPLGGPRGRRRLQSMSHFDLDQY